MNAARRIVVASALIGFSTANACLLQQDLGSDDREVRIETGARNGDGADSDGNIDANADAQSNPDSGAGPGARDDAMANPDADAATTTFGEAFDAKSCPAAPIGTAGFSAVLNKPIPYRIYVRARDCSGDNFENCTPWTLVPDDTSIDLRDSTLERASRGVFRPGARTGNLVFTHSVGTFDLRSAESCGPNPGFYGSHCEVQDVATATCSFFLTPPARSDAGSSSCGEEVAIAYWVGNASQHCIQVVAQENFVGGRQYQFAILARF